MAFGTGAASCSIELSVDAYCTLSQIGAYIPRRTLSDSSVPTRRQAINTTIDIYREINGLLDYLGYIVPVASGTTAAVRILGRLNALGAAADIESAAYSAGNSARSEHAQDLREEYQVLYTKIQKGQLSLPSAARGADYTPTQGERQIASSFETTRTFTKSMNF